MSNNPNHLDEDPVLARLHLQLLLALQENFGRIDPDDPECLKLALDIFDKARVEHGLVAAQLGVGPSTVSRWSTKAIRPKSIAFRRAMLSGMVLYFDHLIDVQKELIAELEAKASP
jgi:hypothetical protein